MLAVLVLAACGSETVPEEPPGTTELRIVLWPVGPGGERLEARLTCNPPGGDHPNPASACAALAGERGALEPVPPDAACTQQFGGPEEAEVTGTVEGDRVEATFTKRDGCEIARWERLAPLLELRPPL